MDKLLAKRQRGVSLVEVLVSLTLLSFAVLGLANLQLHASQGQRVTYNRSQAMFLAEDLADRLRANRPNILNQDLASCALCQTDITEVNALAADLLPDGQATATYATTTQRSTISVSWREMHTGTQEFQLLMEL